MKEMSLLTEKIHMRYHKEKLKKKGIFEMEMTRGEILKKLRSVQPEMEQYDKIVQQFETLDAHNVELYEKALQMELNKDKKPYQRLRFVATIVVAALTFLPYMYIDAALRMILPLGDGGAIDVAICFVLCAITGEIIPRALYDASISRIRKQMRLEGSDEIKTMQEQSKALSHQMHEKIGFLDEEYCYSWAIRRLDKILQTDRASNLEDAMVELDKDIKKQEEKEAKEKTVISVQ